eukprot:gnl/TRDRNA2_/TRDRNA2_198399_c0_seq1.p1 gnl/TRDRNA2_/TRDRNA2_198399_c0~~gnl/TRDRNA2_/TRDRNA2_198399_c0_seq1.p1  ORF type:complete len:368 (-),score=72.07 gnl/TRDRNA2_/TRDRNA2_198399_c0_seq1:139-1242(-)
MAAVVPCPPDGDDCLLLPESEEEDGYEREELRIGEGASGVTKHVLGSLLSIAGLVSILVGLVVRSTVSGVTTQSQPMYNSAHLSEAIVSRDEEAMSDAQKMVAKYSSVIDELSAHVVQCDDQVQQLKSLKPYVINAMVSAVGETAKACDLVDYDVHHDPPTAPVSTCAVHCGEDDCPVSLIFMKKHKETLKKNCGGIIYMQGGALCWVNRDLSLKNRTECALLTEGKSLYQYKKFADEIGIQEIECGKPGWTYKLNNLKSPYIWNTMIGVFGTAGDSCSPSTEIFTQGSVHGSAPSHSQDNCLVYCGESFCPYTQDLIKKQSPMLSKHCKNIFLLRGGAKCLMESDMPVKDKAGCSKIVFGKKSKKS